MNVFQALVLAIVEGITEFLPVSSTGHLIITQKLLQVSTNNFTKSFDIIIQLGAILAVIAIYRHKIFSWVDWVAKIMVAFAPTVVVGFLVYPYVKEYFLNNYWLVTITLAVGGLVMIIFEKYRPTTVVDRTSTLKEITYRQAFIIGCCQTLAIIPGVSRSAATIIGGLAIGLTRAAALEFSFLLAVPTMVAAVALDLLKSGFPSNSSDQLNLAVGFVGSFVCAFFAVRWLLSYVATRDFSWFGWYRILAAIAFAAVVLAF